MLRFIRFLIQHWCKMFPPPVVGCFLYLPPPSSTFGAFIAFALSCSGEGRLIAVNNAEQKEPSYPRHESRIQLPVPDRVLAPCGGYYFVKL